MLMHSVKKYPSKLIAKAQDEEEEEDEDSDNPAVK